MQTEKVLINDRLRVSKVSWKFQIPTIYTFAVIYLWNLLFSLKVAYILTVSIVFSVYKQTSRLNNLNIRRSMNIKISVFAFCAEAIIYLLLHNLCDNTFNERRLETDFCSKCLPVREDIITSMMPWACALRNTDRNPRGQYLGGQIYAQRTVCNFQSMKNPVELSSLFSKLFCYITLFVISPA